MDLNANSILLNVEMLSCKRDARIILDAVSFSVAKGEFVGLVGPNGSGKTTLLRCLAGLQPSTGTIEIDGSPLSSGRALARRVSFMRQDTGLQLPFSVRDVVLMGRNPHQKRFEGPNQLDRNLAQAAMERTETLVFADRAITELSGGERQRVLFARSLAQNCPLVLLDEPSASLDLAHQEALFRDAATLAREGHAVIAAVHDLRLAARHCTRLIMLSNGKVLADGAPEQVLTGPRLAKAWGVNALVYRNRISGELDFHLHEARTGEERRRIHVIGGGGAAAGLLRSLFEAGFVVSAGAFWPGDSDLHCAEALGMEHLCCEPFSDISDEVFEQTCQLIRQADITIIANIPFGRQNVRLLQAAEQARRLVLIEDDDPAIRDFSGGAALDVYQTLRPHATVSTLALLHEVL